MNCLAKKDNGGSMPVRHRIALLAAALMSCALLLSGCASEGEKSAREIAVTPALSGNIEIVEAGMLEHQEDAKLVGISTRNTLIEGDQSEWAYLYVSREQVREYSCTVKSGEFSYTTRRQNGGSFLSAEMEAIPDPDEILVDADAAYELVSKNLTDDQLVETLDVYLRTFVSVVEGGENVGVETMVWYFAFNQDGGENEAEVQSPAFVYMVDAVTGEILFAGEAEGGADEDGAANSGN